jgi:hypothetical protein
MKVCFKCGEPKSINDFHISKRAKDGHRTNCKPCTLKENRDSQKKHPEAPARAKNKWLKKNREYKRIQGRNYWKRPENKQARRDNSRRYAQNHPERIRQQQKRFRNANRVELNRKNREKILVDGRYHIRQRFSSMFSRRMKRHSVAKRTGNSCFSALPYTVEELILHIEGLFQAGMSWNNYGEWHLDHIRPDSSFTYSSVDDEEFKQCWSLDNLQPLWAEDNRKKSNKWQVEGPTLV